MAANKLRDPQLSPLLHADYERELAALDGDAPAATDDAQVAATIVQVQQVHTGGGNYAERGNIDKRLGTFIEQQHRYQTDPNAPQRAAHAAYLQRLASELSRLLLLLRGLDETLHQGQGIDLAKVYMLLATERRVAAVRGTK